MRFRIFDSETVYESATSRDVIENVKNNSRFTEHQTINEYVAEYRKRYFRANGELLGYDYDKIVKSMIEKKIIEVLEE